MPQRFTYYHIELDDHALIVVADSTPAETFVDNVDRLNFDNWDEHEAIFPEGKSVVEMEYPPGESRSPAPAAHQRVNRLPSEPPRVWFSI